MRPQKIDSMKRVFKFGGASIKDALAVRNMAEIIKREYKANQLLIVVVSAMGKVTNALEEILYKTLAGKNVKDQLESLKSFHFEIIDGLELKEQKKLTSEINDLLIELQESLENIYGSGKSDEAEKYDKIVSNGEIISSLIINHYLKASGMNSQWLDARKYIKTSNDFREGIILWNETDKRITNISHQPQLYLTQGFIGSNLKNQTNTLGREGSDFSAAIFGQAINAESVTIWKDVPGILNADPKLFSDTDLFENLSYSEASEMTYYGASVIHPKTIKPLANKKIPLLVKSFKHPENRGTVIGPAPSTKQLPVTILKSDQALLSFKVKDFTFINEEQIGMIFHALNNALIKINVMQNSAISLTISVDNRRDKIEKLINELNSNFDIEIRDSLSLFTIINHEESSISRILQNHKIILEQRTLKTCQYLVSEISTLD